MKKENCVTSIQFSNNSTMATTGSYQSYLDYMMPTIAAKQTTIIKKKTQTTQDESEEIPLAQHILIDFVIKKRNIFIIIDIHIKKFCIAHTTCVETML